jgi:hypothetical protein
VVSEMNIKEYFSIHPKSVRTTLILLSLIKSAIAR